MWPGFDSPRRRHKWVEFVGSLLCTERQGPSCSSLDQIPDMRVVYIRFIEPAQSYSATSGHEAADDVPGMKRKQQTQFKSTSEPSSKKKKSCVSEMVAKSLSLVEMLKLGKLSMTDLQIWSSCTLSTLTKWAGLEIHSRSNSSWKKSPSELENSGENFKLAAQHQVFIIVNGS